MSSSQKCHAISVGLHACPWMCKCYALCFFVASLSMVLSPSMFLLLFQPLCFIFPSLLHMLYFQNRKCSFKQYAPLSSYWHKDGRYFSFPFLWFQLNKKKAGLLSGFALLAESGAASAIYKWTIHKSLGHTTREVSTVPVRSGIFLCVHCGLLFPPLHHSSKLGSG